ncbi:MAG: HNH endonuclease [Armatimonadetes bacterium]|nr:HNH endonuclease [Armatimonadota bacterium]
MNQEVLVLNSDYEPLNVCHARRALVLVFLGKADVLHAHDRRLPAVNGTYPSPSVVRLKHHVKRPLPELKLSRRTVFARDNYTCQYCGQVSRELTIDHVIPKRHGGPTAWDNLVTACRRCNMKKSDKLLHQTAMRLVKPPARPRYVPYISLTKYLVGRRNEVWRDYLPVFTDVHD